LLALLIAFGALIIVIAVVAGSFMIKAHSDRKIQIPK